MVRYYNRNGVAIGLYKWAELIGDSNYRIIAQHNVGNLCVSTVWLGLDHRVFGDGEPLIFESMIFEVPQGDEHWRSLEMRRYCTELEAKVGHTDLVYLANTMADIEAATGGLEVDTELD